MKSTKAFLTMSAALTATAFAGSASPQSNSHECGANDAFASAIRPISNPTLFDLALPRTNVHGIFMNQQMPSRVATAGGGAAPLGGDFQVYAVQLEYAFHERLSLVATKDGYVNFNPDTTLSEEDGFANLAAGLKYAMIFQPENGFALSGTATVEIPTGSDSVTEGEGDGAVNLILSSLKMAGAWQFSSGAGLHLPFDGDANAVTSFVSTHLSYQVHQYFIPLIELNWYHVVDEGDGSNRFGDQIGGALPSVIAFEGGDLLNWGASNAKDNADIVTMAAGFRSRLNDNVNAGVSYELPLTDKESNLMESRLTVDLVWNF
jgi:hypothetical protein